MNETSRLSPWKAGGRWRLFLAVAAVLACLACVVCLIHWLIRPARQEAMPMELARTNLVLREGRMVALGQTNPFHGVMVEFYPDGTRQSRSSLSNGLLHGVSEGWHTNGVLAVCEHFQTGVSHGLRTKYYPSGAKLSETMIVNGNLQGAFRRWHENGVLAEEIEMKDGQPDGLSRSFFPSGFLKGLARLEKGRLVEQKSWIDGELKP